MLFVDNLVSLRRIWTKLGERITYKPSGASYTAQGRQKQPEIVKNILLCIEQINKFNSSPLLSLYGPVNALTTPVCLSICFSACLSVCLKPRNPGGVRGGARAHFSSNVFETGWESV